MGQIDAGIPAVLVRGLKIPKSDKGINSRAYSPEDTKKIAKHLIKANLKVLGFRNLLKSALGKKK